MSARETFSNRCLKQEYEPTQFMMVYYMMAQEIIMIYLGSNVKAIIFLKGVSDVVSGTRLVHRTLA
jgi:hypothetical protein